MRIPNSHCRIWGRQGGGEYLQHPRSMHGSVGKYASPRDAVRTVCANDNLRTEITLIRLDYDMILIGNDVLNHHSLSNLYSPGLCLFRQPVVKLVATDDAQRMS